MECLAQLNESFSYYVRYQNAKQSLLTHKPFAQITQHRSIRIYTQIFELSLH